MQLEPLSAAALLADAGCAEAPQFVRNFDHAPNAEVIFGTGVISLIGQKTSALGVKRVLVVTDPGIAAAGHLAHVLGYLHEAGLEVHTFTDVCENPTTDVVDACVHAARECHAQALIGLGGGSSMDAAKGCNFLLTNGGQIRDYWGSGKAAKPMLPFIAVPTTAGTGSECQSYALISDAQTHVKMACGDKKAAARHAYLDPALTFTQPPLVTRHTGIDALTHALESIVSRTATDISRAYSLAAFGLLASGFPGVLRHPSNVSARSKMLLGAALAGVAIENSMLGAAHSAANPLTAQFEVVHGEAVAVMLPHVIRLNLTDPAAAAGYAQVAAILRMAAADLPDWFQSLLAAAHLPTRLSHYRISAADLPALAEGACQQWTAGFNPVPVDAAVFEKLYAAAL